MIDIKRRPLNYVSFYIDILPTIITFVGLIICGIIFKQDFVKLLPCLISLIVMLLSAKANRLSFLIGAINGGIYCIGFLNERLYGSVGNCIFSVIIQIYTYFRWKKTAYKNATIFKKMTNKMRLLTFIAFIAVWIISYIIFTNIGANYVVLDNTLFVLGIIIPIMVCFAYMEVISLNILSAVLTIIIWVTITINNIANITYLIFSIYSLLRIIQGAYMWHSLYREQQQLSFKI